MAGLIGNAPLTSVISLFLEIAVVIALFIGRFMFARRKKFRMHGFVMALAVGLHVLSVLLVMIPSFAVSLDLLLQEFLAPTILITWIHVPTGGLALILGAYLILEWRFRSPNTTCFKRARLMRPLWLLWVFSIIVGLIIFAALVFS